MARRSFFTKDPALNFEMCLRKNHEDVLECKKLVTNDDAEGQWRVLDRILNRTRDCLEEFGQIK